MELHLVRHPAPLAAPGMCYGRTDVAVAPEDTAAAVARLRPLLPVAPLFTSPLQRCAMLAHSLSGQAIVDARLSEIDFGSWEMRPWDNIARDEVDAWAADVVHYRPGGGESVLQMAQRIAHFHDALVLQRIERGTVICHAGSIRLLAARHRGLDPQAMALHAAATPHAIAYGEIVVLPGV
ncbi:histidine phosphatase family protein [Massilia sp. PAMC28688]|uniref:histidine phosphatase family protein n=1 Tax=Massilia sp. PAMC28688 TaxID=2861283 RepID=UPI001C6398B5|nr:histidine phosphatase family protein [Massilia sp. PAMC28688]QYF94590.1 histidine phosphatase family protein [Massilia sp. PAMC28688]